MGLSANLFLRQTQSLVMTPQLMQSIQLLQMTHFELNQFIAQEVEKNPLLEITSSESENDAETGFETADDFAPIEDRESSAAAEVDSDWYEGSSSISAERLGEGLDTGFENVFPDDGPVRRADAPELLSQWKSMPGGESGEDYDLDDFVAGQVTLRDHLNQQIPFLIVDAAGRLIAQHLVDQLDEAGYMLGDIEEIAARLGRSSENVEAILHSLQTLDPPGVFARSLSECLAIQLREKDRLDPAMEALIRHLDLLGKRDFASLRKICGVDDEDLIDMLAEIRGLNPKPGAGFERGMSETISPDIVVRAAPDGGWMVELNPDTLPRVLVNHTYFQTVSKNCPKNGDDHNFLSDCMQNANWLTRSLDQRAKTIMKVATEIVRQQDAFLMHGVDHLRPLNLKTVAEAIKMHESTVSRVTSNKYMLTPRGLFELKYFFTVSIGSAEEGGDSHSAEAVRHRIRLLIAQETPDAVLSDDDIVISLKRGGVELARRTVAKYREAMNIPSSVQRRREKRAIAGVAAY
ncbi:RNA polymerase factor sigma-54 [Neorhizobium galegae]|uniref:RNA polymerase factor sigma-54 n=1 Tax=Neorhizobium galegae TaxID=399 RepID=UPI0021043DB1|nr:RNA polymerase factor sigma-54 [Neorhizobium galegae]MCQ1808910.1 RNA polymerase factor sigma-54 [Neorhizobium galegae]